MPAQAPPRRTRHGHLHAVGLPPLPVHPGAQPAPTVTTAGGAGLAGRIRPVAVPATDAIVVGRRLDRGRLCASELVTAVGWMTHTRLAATPLGPGRVVLRPAPAVAGPTRPVAGTSTPHTDARGFVVLPEAVRAWLGVEPDGQVIARTVAGIGDAVEIVTADLIAGLLDAGLPDVPEAEEGPTTHI